MTTRKRILFSLLIVLFLQGCVRTRTVDSGQPTIAATSTVQPATSTVTITPLPSATVVPTATEVLPTPEPAVTITAISGNLYIRRGPGTEYDRIGLLKKGDSAQVLGRDVLSRWVQVNIPESDRTGWVSLMTDFAEVTGDLSQVADFTFTDWPQPAYIKNCTEHDILVQPGEYYLYNLFTNANYLNEVQVDPGVYTIYDMFMPGEPQIEIVDVQEGETVYITVNGLGVKHNCP